MSARWRDSFRYHPEAEVDKLLDWCATVGEEHVDARVAIGLALAWGLNEHQIALTAVLRRTPLLLEFPNARRPSAIIRAERRPLELPYPDWLREAVETLAARQPDIEPPFLLFRSRSRVQTPVTPSSIRTLVKDAATEACGIHMSPATLSSTYTYRALKLDAPSALQEVGHSDAWGFRLSVAGGIPYASRRTR